MRAYVRAGMITLALFSQCISSLPDRPLNTERLARPEGRRALRWLSAVVAPFGLRDQTWLQKSVIVLSERAVAGRRDLLRPIEPLMRLAALRQQWRLFLTVQDVVFRMRIDAGLASGDWRVIYRANGDDPLGLAPMLDYRRLRGIYNPHRRGVSHEYAGFCAWLARRIWRQHAGLDHLRIGMERLQIRGRGLPPEVIDVDYVVEHRRREVP